MQTNPLADLEELLPSWILPLVAPVKGPLQACLGLDGINALYERCKGLDPEAFSGSLLAALGIEWDISEAEVARLRSLDGPLIVTSNHPFGGPEAILMVLLLSRIRPDYRIMANFILGRIPELRERLILVDPFATKNSASRNLIPIRESLKWLSQGGLLGIFPAGAVSSWNPRSGKVEDQAWSEMVPRLARKTGAAVLPLHFEGRNKAWFSLAGIVSPNLRTLLLPRALLHPATRHLRFKFGGPIPAIRLNDLDDKAAAAYLRGRCYLLRGVKTVPRRGPKTWLETAPESDPDILRREVGILREQGHSLAAQGDFEVFQFRVEDAPTLFDEIGRQRELSFRSAGEGTGRPRDQDSYDKHYLHLAVWDNRLSRVAGAYRLVEADRVLKDRGPSGLYTHCLFKLKPEMLRELEHSVELGRSFVSPAYQGEFLPLFLLWRGIGAWISAHPGTTRLFGCVSISPDFKPLTQQLLVSFLQRNNFDLRRSAWVTPRLAFKADRSFDPILRRAIQLDSMRHLQELVDEIEGGKLKVPTLLKHYLKLGGRILAFNIDPDFNNTLDGLFLVDLPRSPQAILEKYMGAGPAQAYLAQHREERAA